VRFDVVVSPRLSRPGVQPVHATGTFYDAVMSTRYVCDYCGHQGKVPGDEPAERIQCPMCGEPVTPLD
jgi:DNA-directed RNA polymerase subunit RPC12/RpoP